MENKTVSPVELEQNGQVTIPAELPQESSEKHPVSMNDVPVKRGVMSFAGVGKGLWGNTPDEVDASLKEIHDLWG